MSHALVLATALACATTIWAGGDVEAQLWVSAQDHGERFAGAQIIHVAVDERDEIAEEAGAPYVTVGGQMLGMIQGTDGRWHAYFAAHDAALAADATATVAGRGLDFGTICGSSADANALLGIITQTEQEYFDDADAVAFPLGGRCDDSYGEGGLAAAVLRDARPANTIYGIGQSIRTGAGADDAAQMVWPFVQIYELGDTVEVRHNSDAVSLEYVDADELASLSLDRAAYPPGADIHIEITNAWFNVDPTDEDSWTWDVDGEGRGRVYYGAFDSRGAPTGNTADVSGAFDQMGCRGACSLGVDLGGGALETVANGNGGASLVRGGPDEGLLTLAETGRTTGVFASYDRADRSSLRVSESAPRGTALVIEYDGRISASVGLSDARLGIDAGGALASGTRAPVTLSDADRNQNSRQKESLDASDPGSVVPTIITGDPVTLAGADGVITGGEGGTWDPDAARIDARGHRAILSPEAAFSRIIIDFGGALSGAGPSPGITRLLNYDVESLGPGGIDIHVLAGSGPLASGPPSYEVRARVAAGAEPRGLVAVPAAALEAASSHPRAGIEFSLAGTHPGGVETGIIADVFSFGIDGEGRGVADQIVRLELEETGSDEGTFAGIIEYMMANQLSVVDSRTYSDLATIGDRATMVIVGGRDDLVLEYVDDAADGSSRTITVVTEPRSHLGSVSFDRDEYGASDTVTVTLRDADLNTSSDTIESYAVGAEDGNVLVLTLNGRVWTDRPGCAAPGPSLRLVETDESSGVFVGQLKVPRQWCDGRSDIPVTTANTRIGITYAEYTMYDEDTTVVEPEHARAFPLAIEGVRAHAVACPDMQDGRTGCAPGPGTVRIEADVSGVIGTEFELVMQVVDENGIVYHIASEGARIISDSPVRISFEWAPGQEGEYLAEAFAWGRGGAVLAGAPGAATLGVTG